MPKKVADIKIVNPNPVGKSTSIPFDYLMSKERETAIGEGKKPEPCVLDDKFIVVPNGNYVFPDLEHIQSGRETLSLELASEWFIEHNFEEYKHDFKTPDLVSLTVICNRLNQVKAPLYSEVVKGIGNFACANLRRDLIDSGLIKSAKSPSDDELNEKSDLLSGQYAKLESIDQCIRYIADHLKKGVLTSTEIVCPFGLMDGNQHKVKIVHSGLARHLGTLDSQIDINDVSFTPEITFMEKHYGSNNYLCSGINIGFMIDLFGTHAKEEEVYGVLLGKETVGIKVCFPFWSKNQESGQCKIVLEDKVVLSISKEGVYFPGVRLYKKRK